MQMGPCGAAAEPACATPWREGGSLHLRRHPSGRPHPLGSGGPAGGAAGGDGPSTSGAGAAPAGVPVAALRGPSGCDRPLRGRGGWPSRPAPRGCLVAQRSHSHARGRCRGRLWLHSRRHRTRRSPRGCACRALRLDALPVCASSRRAVDHASIMHLSFAQRKGHQINHIFFVRKW